MQNPTVGESRVSFNLNVNNYSLPLTSHQARDQPSRVSMNLNNSDSKYSVVQL